MSGSNYDPNKQKQQQYDKKPGQGQQPGQGGTQQKPRDPFQKDKYKEDK